MTSGWNATRKTITGLLLAGIATTRLPSQAAAQFLENYQKDRNGARSADSLLFLSEAMVGIGDTDRACIALAEFSEAYPAIATGRLKEQYDRNRSKVTCR